MQISFNHVDISFRDYADFIVIYNLRSREILKLENVAADIWRIIASASIITSHTIIEKVANLYDCATDDVTDDIVEFINELYKAGIISIDNEYALLQHTDTTQPIAPNDVEGEIIQEMKERNQLYSATFEMTYNCNEKCVHCYAHYPGATATSLPILTKEKYKDIIDELYQLNCLHLAFTGGDPFMYPGFPEIYFYARSKGFVCDIYTNGLYLADHPEMLQSILDSNPRAFYISLYGSTSQIHDAVTTIPGSFKKTLRAIKCIQKKHIPVVLNIMLLSINYDDVTGIINLAKSLGVEYRIGMSLIYRNDGNASPMDYFIHDPEIIKSIMKLVQKDLYSIDIPLDDTKEVLPEGSICNAGSTTLSLAPDGTIYPCISLKKELGNVRYDSLHSIWVGNKRAALTKSLRWENTRHCMHCKTRQECPHCVGISQQEHGDIHACNTCDKLLSECLYEVKHSHESEYLL